MPEAEVVMRFRTAEEFLEDYEWTVTSKSAGPQSRFGSPFFPNFSFWVKLVVWTFSLVMRPIYN